MDTWKMITDRMTQLKPLHDRMDKTKDMVYLTPFELTDFNNRKMSNVIHVTGNKVAVFGNSIISDLMKAKWQTVVEGKLTTKQAHTIEQFIEDNLDQVDEYLLERYGIVGLHEWLCNHVCVRGPIGAEWVSYIEDGQYKVHCVGLDMRWAPFLYGQNGLEWVAPITYRTRDELEAEIPEVRGKLSAKTNIEVRDYWNSEKNELWVAKQKFREVENLSGTPPFVIVFPPAGFMLRDPDYLEHEAEDIFFMIRDLNEEYNRNLSIEQTLGFENVRPPYEQEVDVLTAEPAQPPPKTDQTLKVKKGERHQLLPRGQFDTASQAARQDIFKMIDEGAPIAPRLYTTPPSGAELVAEMEALARLQNSRIIALKVFREQLSRLMIDQYIKLAKKGSFSIGKRGKKNTYSVVNLKDPDTYTVSCQLMTKSKRQELANLAMFAAAYDRLPLKYNLTNILMADDPDGILKDWEIEQAKKADPAIALHEMAVRYAEEAADIDDETESDTRKIQSMMLTERAVAIIKQRSQPAQPPLPEKARVPQEEKPTGGQPLMPLLGQGGVMPRMPQEERQ